MNLLNFYESLLLTANFEVNKDGAVSVITPTGKEPMVVKQKRLVIPTREQLKAPGWDKRILFHVLAENILKGETEVFSRYRTALLQRLNISFGTLAITLMDIAASQAVHKTLTIQQSEYLKEMTEADEKSVENFRKLMEKIPAGDHQKGIVSIFLKRNGKVGKTSYPRVGVVKFPLYDELVNAKEAVIYGVKLRKKDIELYRKLFEYIIPGIDNPEEFYNTGSDSMIAPYTVALMSTVAKVVAPLNELLTLFMEERDPENYNRLLIRTDWLPLVQDLTPLANEIRLIPNMDNDIQATPASPNAALQNFEAPVAEAPAPQPVAPQPVQQAPVQQVPAQPVYQPQQSVYQQPVAPVPPAPQKPGNSVDDILRMKYQGQPQQFVPQPQLVQQPMLNGWGQPIHNVQQQYVQQPFNNGWPVQQPQQYFQQPTQQMHPIGAYGYPIKG